MENQKQFSGSSSSSMTNLDHLFGPKDSSSASSSYSHPSTGILGSIFPPPSVVLSKGRKRDSENEAGSDKYGNPENNHRGRSSGVANKDMSCMYQKESAEPCYFSSSIYYGGQENYSPTTNPSQSHHIFKKDRSDDDPSNSCASRGNWWQGSLYY